MLLRFFILCLFLLAPLTAFAQEGIFWTKKQVLETFLAKSEKVISEKVVITPQKLSEIKSLIGYGPERKEYTFFIGQSGEKTDGYVLFDDQLGQHKPISYAVHISPEGRILQTEIMIYREPQGGEVKERKFMRQYEGKSLANPLRVNSDVVAISGATISSKALTIGVKRSLALWKVFFGGQS